MSKIFVLLLVMIYFVAILRASLDIERVRNYLAGKHRGMGYLLGSCFGAVTPFCSCSSIPVFLGFTSAGIPLGITMAFLITSPLINEVAVLLLVSLLGWKFTLIYIAVGMAVGMAGGA
ncbi:permease, partial [Enterobacter hormaechei]